MSAKIHVVLVAQDKRANDCIGAAAAEGRGWTNLPGGITSREEHLQRLQIDSLPRVLIPTPLPSRPVPAIIKLPDTSLSPPSCRGGRLATLGHLGHAGQPSAVKYRH